MRFMNKKYITFAASVFCAGAILAAASKSQDKLGVVFAAGSLAEYGYDYNYGYDYEDEITDGWQSDDAGNYSYYQDGEKVTGWQTIDGRKFYFDKDGIVLTGFRKIDGKLYYLGDFSYMDIYYGEGAGTIETGFVYIYSYNENGAYSSGYYYVNDDLTVATGWKTINGVRYYFNENGIVQSGLLKKDGKIYYLGYFDYDSAKSGVATPVEKGFVELDNISGNGISYVNDDQSLQTGWMDYKGRKLYFDENGILKTGVTKISGVLYYLGDYVSLENLKAGKVEAVPTGFYQTGYSRYYGDIYYIYDDLRLAVGWAEINGKRCLFNAEGVMQSGWQQSEGKWYYLGADIDNYGVETNCWYDGCWLGADGVWDASYSMSWSQDSWGWYITDNYGWYPYSQWQKIDGCWYYFDEWGYMVRSTWKNIGGTYYYFNYSGLLASGATINGEETGQWIDGYWVDHSGAWTGRTGYWWWDGTGYSLYDNTGAYAKDTTLIIDQTYVSFDSAGYAVGWDGYLTTVPPMGGAPSATKDSVIQYAGRSLGFPYVYGGQTMAGTDCSGFTMLSWAYAGYSLPHNAGLQYSTYSSQEVWISEVQPGDLLFYYSGDIANDAGTGIGHTALYIGNGETLEAGDTTNGNRWYADKAVYIIK